MYNLLDMKNGGSMNKTKKYIIWIIQIILVMVILYNGYQIFTYYYSRYKADSVLKKVSSKVEKIEKEELSKPGIKIEKLTKEDEIRIAKRVIASLKETNEDVTGFIKISDTQVSYPILYRDNEYYLYLDINEEWSNAGSIFMEEANKTDFTDMNTTIYGHNMHYTPMNLSPMFKEVVEFINPEYVAKRKDNIIEIYTEKGINRYKIFSAYISDAYDDYRKPNRSADIWVEYLNEIKEKSEVDFKYKKKFTIKDKIITLSTCDLVTEDGRVVVHAVLINE